MINNNRFARGLLDWMQDSRPVVDRATLLPIGQYEDGSLTFAWPGFLMDAWEGGQRTLLDAARAPVPDAPTGTKWSSNVDALNVASLAPMAGVAGRAAGMRAAGLTRNVSDPPATPTPPSVAPGPQDIRAYHGTFNDIEGPFRPEGFGTHFGTPDQAAKMLEIKRNAGMKGDHDGAVYPVDIRAERVFDGNDMQHIDPRFLIRDLRDANDVPKNILAEVDQLSQSGKRQEAFNLVRQAFVDAGYDAYRYQNRVEGPGWSYVPLRPGTVRSPTTGELLYANPSTAALPALFDYATPPGGLLAPPEEPPLPGLLAYREPFGPKQIPRNMQPLTYPWDAKRPDWDIWHENLRERWDNPVPPPVEPPQDRRQFFPFGRLNY